MVMGRVYRGIYDQNANAKEVATMRFPLCEGTIRRSFRDYVNKRLTCKLGGERMQKGHCQRAEAFP